MAPAPDPEVLLDPGVPFGVEIIHDRPAQPADHSFAGEDAGFSSPEDALVLRVIPHSGEPWTGRFEGGYRSPAAVTTVRSGPRPNLLLVVNSGSGFLVPVDDPDAAIPLGLSPIVGVAVSSEHDTVVAADFTNLTGFAPAGPRWTAEVSWDGVQLDGIRDGIAEGRGWDAPEDRTREFAVDVRSGHVLRGVTPRP